ncbi:2-polyprenyl-6-methoxyphenol hydroxylase [Paenibacillus sp. 5J-6]|uniref:2-polyprenyl-6-methoxyphenol hydroxylase n=1 Tax=Paenibacillus silvestris TaxID=2606219 RepID=A0A6L8VC45_9BACL|nr:FAD-dependent monooxygenase [Paenibacillus silvestris]MZQ87236.1 2-polyprenyl-6-methoxyphenol hydroxylase [Paenibacillus silvestris]
MESIAPRKKAIIIGAGIGGLTTALFLQKIGWETVIYEKKETRAAFGAGIVIAANALHVLSELGVAEKVKQAGARVGQADIRSWDGKAITAVPVVKQAALYGTYSYLIHRAKLQAILVEHLSVETMLHDRKKMISCNQHEDEVIVHFEDGTEDSGDILIGSDGLHSDVAKLLFDPGPLQYSGFTAFRGVAAYANPAYTLEVGGDFEAWGSGKRFGFSQLGEGQIYWFVAINAPEGKDVWRKKEHVLQQLQGWHAPIEQVVRATDEQAILKHDIYDRKPLHAWSKGRVVLLGDAAHPMLPNLGQGGAQAMEDAYVLARCLKEIADVSSNSIRNALESYEAIRIPRANRVVQQSRRMARMVQMNNFAMLKARNLVLSLFPDSFKIKQLDWLLGYRMSEWDNKE